MNMEDDRLRFAPNNQRVHPLETFDTPACSLVMKASEADLRGARWLLAKRLAGHSCKVRWDRAQAIILNSADAGEDERLALRDFFTELDGLEIAQVMRAAGATPGRMAALFREIDVRQWQAVLLGESVLQSTRDARNALLGQVRAGLAVFCGRQTTATGTVGPAGIGRGSHWACPLDQPHKCRMSGSNALSGLRPVIGPRHAAVHRGVPCG